MGQVQASSRVDTNFGFTCEACGYEGNAAVVGEGFTTVDDGHDAFPVAGAHESALDHAEGLAWADALTTVELAPCPRCHTRDAARWRGWVAGLIAPALAWAGLGGFIGAVGLFLLRPKMDGWPLLAGGVTSVVVATSVLSYRVVRKRRRSQGLRFEPPA